MNPRRPLKRLTAILAAAALGLTAAFAIAAPAAAGDSHKGGHGHQKFQVTTEVTGEVECKAGKWHVTWTLKDTTDTWRSYEHATGFIKSKTNGSHWKHAEFEPGATLKDFTGVPKKDEGELTGTQVFPGDTEWVELKAPTGWFTTKGYPAVGGTEGRSGKIHFLQECTIEPSEVAVSADCTEFTVTLEVPVNGETTKFTITTNGGDQGSETLEPGESKTVTVPTEYDGGVDPFLDVTWPGGNSLLTLDDFRADCVGVPEVVVSADCIEFKVLITVPENGLTTDFTVHTADGESETHTVGPGEEAELYSLIEYDGETDPYIEVTWPEGELPFTFEDYDAACIAYSDVTGALWSDCDAVGYEFLNTAVQNGGVTVDVRLEPSEGEAVELTLAPEEFLEGTVPVSGEGEFSVDVYIDDELDQTFVWEYDAEVCDEAPPSGEDTTPVAQEPLPKTGSSLTIAVVSALALAVAGAAVFFMLRRRAAQNW